MPNNSRNVSEAFAAIKQYFIENFDAKEASGGKEIVKKCHFCGDSRDPQSRHLYIGQTPNGTIVYNCFKCNSKGIVDGKFLRDLGCYEPGLINLCQEQNSKSSNPNSSNSGRYRNIVRKIDTFQIIANPSQFTDKKMQYISNRLGYSFSMKDLINFKIVLNLKEFLDFNGITVYSRNKEIIEELDKFFIGFLSMDNRYVILRRLVPEGKVSKYIDTRFVNYDIFKAYGQSYGTKYYTIPNIVNLSIPLEIHIAEGVFDIISIYLNIIPKGTNGIFTAICGKSYENIIKFFILNYGFTGFNLHIYPDNDVKQYEINKIKDITNTFNIKVYIHRNIYEGEKDYGVRSDHIIDKVILL